MALKQFAPVTVFKALEGKTVLDTAYPSVRRAWNNNGNCCFKLLIDYWLQR